MEPLFPLACVSAKCRGSQHWSTWGRGPELVCLQQFAGLSCQEIRRLDLGMLCAYGKQAVEDFLMVK